MPTNRLRERTTNFSGGMMDSATSADDYAANQCALIYNGRVERDNSVACVGGSRLLTSSPATATTYGRGIVEFRPTTGSRELVRFTETGGNTTVARSTDGGQTWSTVATLTGATGDWSLVTMQKGGTNYLLCANGGAKLYKYSGGGSGNWAEWALVPTTSIKYLAVHNERLWATTAANSTVYGSKIWDFETWADPDGLELPVTTHDGENITGLAQAGSVLLVFKRHSTSFIDGFGDSDVIVAAGTRGISGGGAGVGCIAPRSFQAVGTGWVWLSERGLEYFDGQSVQLTAQGAKEYLATIARNRITEATGTGSAPTLPCSVYWPEEQEYWIAWPSSAYALTTTTAVNDEGLILSLRTGAVSKRVWNPPGNTGSRKLYPGSMCLAEITVSDQSYVRPVILTKAGDVLAMDLGTTEQFGPATALPALTSAKLILDADREAWRRGLLTSQTLALSGLTLTDDSGSANHCTGGGSLKLVHNGSNWVFRFASTDSYIAVPAINYSATAVVTVGARVTWGTGMVYLITAPKEAGSVADGFSVVWWSGVGLQGSTKGNVGINILTSTGFTPAPTDTNSMIAVMDKSQPAASETVFYIDGSAVATTVTLSANNTDTYVSLDGRIGGSTAGSNFTGDMARITIQSATPGPSERTALTTYLTSGVQGASEPYEIDFRLRTRLYDFSDPVADKWARFVRIAAIESTDQTIEVFPVTDGEDGPSHFLDMTEATNDKPQWTTLGISQRGANHQVEVRGHGGLKVSAIEVQAQPLGGSLY